MTQLIQRRIALAAAWSIACSAPLAAGTLFEDDFENPVISGYGQGITPEIWIRSSQGFNSGFHGLINKDTEEFSAPVGHEQSYAFR